MKKRSLIVLVGLLIVAIAAAGAFAYWQIPTNVTGNMLTSAKFDVGLSTIGGPSTAKTLNAVWVSPTNWAPGDDAITGKVYMHNNGTVDVNIINSNFQLSGSPALASNICVTAFRDSNGGTPSDDLAQLTPGWVDPAAGCVTLAKLAVAMGNGSNFNSNGIVSHNGIFIAPGSDGWIELTLAFRAGAGNDTIDQSASFNWGLTAVQLPKNPAP